MSSRPVLGPIQHPIQWVLETLSSGAKLAGHETDHLPPTSAEVKKFWIYVSHSPKIIHVIVLEQLYLYIS
jgi:hypothetical protein